MMKISGSKTNSSTSFSTQIVACHVDDVQFRDYYDILQVFFFKLTEHPPAVKYSNSRCTSVCVREVRRKCI